MRRHLKTLTWTIDVHFLTVHFGHLRRPVCTHYIRLANVHRRQFRPSYITPNPQRHPAQSTTRPRRKPGKVAARSSRPNWA
jgi:hypothetical protein